MLHPTPLPPKFQSLGRRWCDCEMAPIHPGDGRRGHFAGHLPTWSPAAESNAGLEAGIVPIESMHIDSLHARGLTAPSPVAHGFMAADAASAALEGTHGALCGRAHLTADGAARSSAPAATPGSGAPLAPGDIPGQSRNCADLGMLRLWVQPLRAV